MRLPGTLARLAFASLGAGLAAAPLSGQARPARAASEPTRAGFSTARLARIDSVMQGAVDRGEIAGAVLLVVRDGQVAYERAVGWADREARRPMRPDALFRIASQTKALTSVAVMMLAEEGRLSIGDQVGRHVPALSRWQVATRADTGRALVPARRPVTLRDLLTHTAGLSYGTDSLVAPLYRAAGLGPATGFGFYTADKDEPVCATMERLAGLPLVAQPGSAWVYGYGTDLLGCVVERASGVPFDEFLRTRITGPLGMTDTHFFVPPAQAGRLATVYASASDTAIARAPEGQRGQGHYVEGPRRNFSGGAGLVSTARDYARFLQMLLDGGRLDGVRVLSPKSIAIMTANQTDTLFARDGRGFSLGFETTERPGAGNRLRSVGTYGWGGAYGSSYFVDPRERLVFVYMVQQIPNRSTLALRLENMVYGALVESREPAR